MSQFEVSTHSRPKAAGRSVSVIHVFIICFNSQPPEGGWLVARRPNGLFNFVSTHSRPKAAGRVSFCCRISARGFNSQPPEGGWM